MRLRQFFPIFLVAVFFGFAAWGEDAPRFHSVHEIQEAAESGDADAQTSLGWVYYKGLAGVEQNYTSALHWYEKAVEQNYAPAQFQLGWLYHHGHGVPLDYTKAAQLYEQAANAGDGQAQGNLALMYVFGRGVEQNPVTALMWLTLASSPANKNNVDYESAMTRRKTLEGLMRKEDIEQAQILVQKRTTAP